MKSKTFNINWINCAIVTYYLYNNNRSYLTGREVGCLGCCIYCDEEEGSCSGGMMAAGCVLSLCISSDIIIIKYRLEHYSATAYSISLTNPKSD